MENIKITLLKGGIAAIILWLFSGVIPAILLLFALILIGIFSRPQPRVQILGEISTGKFSLKWAWTDWLGLILLLAVVYAVWSHVDPLKLIQLLKEIAQKS